VRHQEEQHGDIVLNGVWESEEKSDKERRSTEDAKSPKTKHVDLSQGKWKAGGNGKLT